jgi:hypothetical protein
VIPKEKVDKQHVLAVLAGCPVPAGSMQRTLGCASFLEQAEGISTLLPSLMRYDQNTGVANQLLRERLSKMPLNHLQK